jgi:hypothetical protein
MRESPCIPAQFEGCFSIDFHKILTTDWSGIVSDIVRKQPQDVGATLGAAKGFFSQMPHVPPVNSTVLIRQEFSASLVRLKLGIIVSDGIARCVRIPSKIRAITRR